MPQEVIHAKVHSDRLLHRWRLQGDDGQAERPGGGRARDRVEASGGKLESYHLTTGPSDFMIIVTIDDVTSLLAGLMVAAGTSAISNVQTARAFSADEFMQMQKKAASIKASYEAPN
jgi:uncharacterized protein with GYD domain